ncbi:hypothetical protein LB518_01655 [Mesorhizobium sp. BR1-1-16]|uniref:hypothetical protein n=1 Tax=Mesorhizobium sp. BR1-1-16 TaxID=2876653 RepID=UPI001CCB4762|nr:hypothetical protein [Mesorhizobium sp. BR1-1-16]MBZ9934984.1 hypothetical protein [Mesorhizobium sp. BR1-1-16]
MRVYFQRYLAWAEFSVFANDFAHYWKVYGGSLALLKSPASLLAALMSLLALLTGRLEFWSLGALASLPALLGFSLGAMAIVLAFPTTSMFKVLAEEGREDSYYIDLASKFVHFILFQTAGLMYTLVIPAKFLLLLDLVGFWLLTYAVLMGLVVAVSLFGTARLYNHPGSH